MDRIAREEDKTGKARTLPVGPRLRAEVAIRRHAPDGQEHSPTAYVFGNEVGEPVHSVKKAWEIAILKSHGSPVVWVKGKPGRLTADRRAGLREINLHVHDLRREFACTLLESAADLHGVRDFLGHANITTTSRYLASSPVRLASALARLDPEPSHGAICQHLHTTGQTKSLRRSRPTINDCEISGQR